MEKGKNVFIAPGARVIGQVSLGDRSSIWFGAVVRGDVEKIEIGTETNIQDLAVIHCDPGIPVKIGDRVTVGHGAIIHGATVGSETLIGIRATVLNNAKIGTNCVIGAHALVTEGMEIPDNSLVMGTPAKVVRKLDEKAAEKIKLNASHYVKLAGAYLEGKIYF